MDNFVVSARKYRPATFDTVVGQHSITSTLQNAIKSNHLAQAFLFCGPRGVGKTTCARILAKTINCTNKTDNVEACGKCDSCTSFQNGQSLNVYELDAASNNSVDDIRQLVDQVRFAPQLGKYKVYIIDEVHMLSTAAFNAFLKTLEEPPAHAIFILATTEKHKIIPTILSRCQIFDFNRIQIKDIADHLAKIGVAENIETEYDGLLQIAQKADGGLRDALSMFDQIVTFAGKITYAVTIENLNILDYEYYFKVTDAVLQTKVSDLLLLFNEVLAQGFDGNNFINGFAEHLRNLLVCRDAQTIQLLEVSENAKAKYLQQSQAVTQEFLISALSLCSKCDLNYKASKNQRLLVELALLQTLSLLKPANGEPLAQVKQNYIMRPYYLLGEKKQTIPPTIKTSTIVIPSITEQPSIVVESGIGTHYVPPAPQDPNARVPLSKTAHTIANLFGGSTSLAQIQLLAQQGKAAPIATTANTNVTAEPETAYGNEAITQENINAAWHTAVEHYAQNMIVYSVLKNCTPILTNDVVVNIALGASFEQNTVNNAAAQVLQILRKECNNKNITFNIYIDETLAALNVQTARAPSANTVYDNMLAKNPHLALLIQQLNLDVNS
ncbi:MAG: DNA polymerase III subunit gamma/tau [Bacteroidia bacterium]|nr:DNA polymerase III subunit gamma/tau [Bacteroidia bacterium]